MNAFCLIDVDSFYPPDLFNTTNLKKKTTEVHPYPETKLDFLYGLWQAVVGAWGVTQNGMDEQDLEGSCKERIFGDANSIANSIHLLGKQYYPEEAEVPSEHAELIAGVYTQGGLGRLINALREDPMLQQLVREG
eukprot:GHVR01123790.1.p1 GENE.GHVR01123790.1~~GHVR01123790.1.p1  ORF type:complete len:135 (-),score=23.38 GHVR01123790.1:283-687(-)